MQEPCSQAAMSPVWAPRRCFDAPAFAQAPKLGGSFAAPEVPFAAAPAAVIAEARKLRIKNRPLQEWQQEKQRMHQESQGIQREQQQQQQQQQQQPPEIALPPGFSPPPGLPTPPGLLSPPPGLEPPPSLNSTAIRLSMAFAAAALPAKAGGALVNKADAADSSTAPSGLTSDTCSTADTSEEFVSPRMPSSPTNEPTAVMLDLCAVLPADESAAPVVFPTSPPAPPSAANCSTSLLSVGSAGHHLGICRPCDFVGRGFKCRSGVDCSFCHLCGPEDRKVRKTQRKKMMKALSRTSAAAGGA